MIRANRRDRDESIDDDLFLIYFDPFLDQQRAYVFTVNGYGVQGDAILQAGALGGGRFGVPRGDASWDVLFDSAAELVDDGFVAELAIPSRASAIRAGRPGRRTAGDCRSRASSAAATRRTSGRPRRATSRVSCPRWACWRG